MPRLNKESLELWASVAEIVAPVGVIISIVYLAIEVNEGTLSPETRTHSDFVELINEPFLAMVSNDELSRVVAQGLSDPESLSPEDWVRFVNYQLVIWNVWGYGFYLNQAGATRIEAWTGGDAYVDPFHSHVEEFVRQNPNYKDDGAAKN